MYFSFAVRFCTTTLQEYRIALLRAGLFICFFIAFNIDNAICQDANLAIYKNDIRLEYAYSEDNNTPIGYNLFVRKKAGVMSVLLTESSGQYAFRAIEWNPVNGNEIRYNIYGKSSPDKKLRFSIISSTSVLDKEFGNAFQLFIPVVILHNDNLSKNGETIINIKNGFDINIRTFTSKYADYTTGRFQNNLFSILPSTVFNIPETVPMPVLEYEVSSPTIRQMPERFSPLMPYKNMPIVDGTIPRKKHNPFNPFGRTDEALLSILKDSDMNIEKVRSELEKNEADRELLLELTNDDLNVLIKYFLKLDKNYE